MLFRRIAQLISAVSLIGVIAPSVLMLSGTLDLEQVKRMMMIATIVWFVATPLWMGVNKPTEA